MTRVTSSPYRFSTVGMPEQRRIELWEAHNTAALIGLRCRTLDAGSLEATEVNLQLEHLHVAKVSGTPHVVERSAAEVRANPTDAVALYFNLFGEAFFYHETGVWTLRPGQVLVCDADRPFMRGFSRGLEELALKVPWPVFTDVTGMRTVPSPKVLDFAPTVSPYGSVLARLLDGAVTAPDPVPVDDRTALELIAALVTGGRDGLPAGHRAAARAYVEAHFADPGLSAARVAAAIGISERHLSRVFAEDGTSVPRHVLGRRLDRAYELLSGRAPGEMTVADTARACGFTSPAHFSHAFRTRYGVRASDVRRQARASPTVESGWPDS